MKNLAIIIGIVGIILSLLIGNYLAAMWALAYVVVAQGIND